MAKVLFAEDDLEFADSMRQFLELHSYKVEHTSDGLDALRFLQSYGFEVAILDWELPGLSGVDVCKRLRKEGIRTPVIMLTGKSETEDTLHGIDAGADDYLVKPVDPRIVLAKVKAVLRRNEQRVSDKLSIKGLELDPENHSATIDDQLISLLPKEFAVLEFFMRNPDKVFSSDDLISRVWSADESVSIESVRTCIFRLRKKLAKFQRAELIENIYGVGYVLRSGV